MRYRKLSPTGDYTFGQPASAEFWVDVPEAVAQSILTRLKLWTGEWFLDLNAGTPWLTQVVGAGTSGTYDQVIQGRILDTTGVLALTRYSSDFDAAERRLTVSDVEVSTIYDGASVQVIAPYAPLHYLVDDQGRFIVDDAGNRIVVVD